jgi:hypothetical protein
VVIGGWVRVNPDNPGDIAVAAVLVGGSIALSLLARSGAIAAVSDFLSWQVEKRRIDRRYGLRRPRIGPIDRLRSTVMVRYYEWKYRNEW